MVWRWTGKTPYITFNSFIRSYFIALDFQFVTVPCRSYYHCSEFFSDIFQVSIARIGHMHTSVPITDTFSFWMWHTWHPVYIYMTNNLNSFYEKNILKCLSSSNGKKWLIISIATSRFAYIKPKWLRNLMKWNCMNDINMNLDTYEWSWMIYLLITKFMTQQQMTINTTLDNGVAVFETFL